MSSSSAAASSPTMTYLTSRSLASRVSSAPARPRTTSSIGCATTPPSAAPHPARDPPSYLRPTCLTALARRAHLVCRFVGLEVCRRLACPSCPFVYSFPLILGYRRNERRHRPTCPRRRSPCPYPHPHLGRERVPGGPGRPPLALSAHRPRAHCRRHRSDRLRQEHSPRRFGSRVPQHGTERWHRRHRPHH